MHSKNKGNIGLSRAIHELHKFNLNVFVELGDLSRIDLIVELTNGKLIRVQVKYCEEINGTAKLSIRKSGPNGYRYTYGPKDIDVFALYCNTNHEIYWVSSKLACQNATEFSIRFKPSINKQGINVNLADNYRDFFKAIE